jgi:ribosomal protein S12 methylthiotransferase accessory factor
VWSLQQLGVGTYPCNAGFIIGNVMTRVISLELNRVLGNIVSHKTGLINQLVCVPLQLDEAPLFVYHAIAMSPLFLRNNYESLPSHIKLNGKIMATGCGVTSEEALWATIGECVERYSGCCWQDFQLVTSTYEDLKHDAIEVEKLILFSPEQYEQEFFSYQPFRSDVSMRWVEGKSLITNKPTYIPAQIVFLEYVNLSQQEMFSPQISTGLAAGYNLTHAIHTGMREAIERDSFACYWLLNAKAPQIILTEKILRQMRPEIRALLDNKKFQVNIRWITTDIDIPVVLVFVKAVNLDGVSIGCCCHTNVTVAIEKALMEAHHTRNWLLDMQRHNTPAPIAEDVRNFEDHVAFYGNPKNFYLLENFYCDEKIEVEDKFLNRAESLEADLDCMIKMLHQSGFESFAADVAPLEVKAHNFCAAKVVIPGLQPLWSGTGNEHRDTRRLESVSRWLNVPLTMRMDPHPFP